MASLSSSWPHQKSHQAPQNAKSPDYSTQPTNHLIAKPFTQVQTTNLTLNLDQTLYICTVFPFILLSLSSNDGWKSVTVTVRNKDATAVASKCLEDLKKLPKKNQN